MSARRITIAEARSTLLQSTRRRPSNDIADPAFRERFSSRIEFDPNGGCWLWAGARGASEKPGGHFYGCVRFGQHTILAHRVAYQLFIGPVPAGADVLHSCDIPECVNPAHLRAGSHGDNMRDRQNRDRTVLPLLKGQNCPWAKLTAPDVIAIRASAERPVDLSARYRVNESTIRKILKGERWANV